MARRLGGALFAVGAVLFGVMIAVTVFFKMTHPTLIVSISVGLDAIGLAACIIAAGACWNRPATSVDRTRADPGPARR